MLTINGESEKRCGVNPKTERLWSRMTHLDVQGHDYGDGENESEPFKISFITTTDDAMRKEEEAEEIDAEIYAGEYRED
jgi:hypothetical protein